MLRKVRIVLAAVVFIGITLLFAGIGQQWWGWLAKLQFLPACLALNVAVIVGIFLLTFIFGRVYCSVICPLGIFQDIVNNISSHRKGKKSRFHFRKENVWLRCGVLVLFVVALLAGIQVIVALLAPYSAYGRMVSSIVDPQGWAVPVIAGVTFITIVTLSWLGGRTWCNAICPVGTLLSFFSRISLFRPTIDTDKCVGCHLCEKKCKASCIDSENKKIDSSRCVDCFDCIENCKAGAIKYRYAYKKASAAGTDAGRRAFVSGIVLAGTTAAVKAQEHKVDGGLAAVLDKKVPQRSERLVPPGAESVKSFYDKCTACQLCVQTCPNNVLRPSTDLGHLMQPQMGYENGYCRPECSKCSQVCPAGAILPVTPEEKTAIHIGRAVIDYDLCIASSQGVSCGNCSYHCPSGAIIMVKKDPSDQSRQAQLIPSVVEDKCIGCGACEYLCPSRPFSAIHVDGLSVHIKD